MSNEHEPLSAEDQAKLLDLLDALYSDGLDAPGQAELDAMLCTSPAAARLYVQQADLHALLQWEHGGVKPPSEEDLNERLLLEDLFSQAVEQRRLSELEHKPGRAGLNAPPQSDRDRPGWLDALADLDANGESVSPVDLTAELARRENASRRDVARRRALAAARPQRMLIVPDALIWIGVAAAIGIVVWLAWPDTKQPETTTPITHHTPSTTENSEPSVAHLSSSFNPHWEGQAPAAGRITQGQSFVLRAGIAQITFDDGATIIIQGPATFEPTGPNTMRLAAGRLSVEGPGSAQGFQLITPAGVITDHGTSFAVAVERNGTTQAHAFAGGLSIISNNADSPGPVTLRAGEALHLTPSGSMRRVQANPSGFVQHTEFEALRRAGHSPQDRWIAARYQMQRKPGLLAFEPFIRPGLDWPGGFGFHGLRRGEATNNARSSSLDQNAYASAVTWQGDDGYGDALVANGVDPIFLDLDTAPGGVFDLAGLLDDGLIGKPGTTLYISWRMQSDGSGHRPKAFAGLSLMRGDQASIDEPLFMGCAASVTDWSVHPRHSSEAYADSVSIHRLTADGRTIPMDERAHLWLVRIEFAQGHDRVSIYLDPDLRAPQLSQPNVTLTGYDVAFDRLRFDTGDGAQAWRVDDILISTTRPTGSPGELPGD